MDNEFDFADAWELIYKKRKKIIKFTLLIVLIALAVSLIMPKTYESGATIKLPEIPNSAYYTGDTKFESRLLFQPFEIPSIVNSYVILQPVIEKVYANDSKKPAIKDLVKDITVKVDSQGTTDQWGNKIGMTSPFVKITAQSDNAEKSRLIVAGVIDGLSDYINKDFNEKKQLIIDEHNNTAENIKKEIDERKINIKNFEEDIADLKTQINSLNLDNEALAQSALLKSIVDNSKGRLLNEKNSKIALEKRLTEEDITFEKRLSGIKEFEVISEPQTPLKHSSPSIKKNLFIALISGLILSIALVFLQEAVRK